MTEYKDSRDDVMTYTANWILKRAGSRNRALQLRKEFMSNKQWVREDIVKEYQLQQQKVKDILLYLLSKRRYNEKRNNRNRWVL